MFDGRTKEPDELNDHTVLKSQLPTQHARTILILIFSRISIFANIERKFDSNSLARATIKLKFGFAQVTLV